jgi:TolB-like protein
MIGQTISHYKILEKLGQGGMGVVYKAQDTKLKRTVALKFLPPDLLRDDQAKERFMQEARAASALDHANICTIYEIGETEDGQLFISMAFYDGESVRERIDRGPLKVDEAVDIAIQTAEGLREAHHKGIVHRDIKPANIMVTSRGQVKIMDFGLAKLAGQTKLTRAGATLGTVAYMSPEQARGEGVDHRTDIWSLGVVFYEMLSGELPFKGEYEQAVVYSILNEEPASLVERCAGVSMELDGLVETALSKKPEERHQTANDLLAALTTLQKMIESQTSQKREPKPHKPSIAVLPFADLSSARDQEYFCDGMAEEIINALAQVEGLRVVARTSAFAFKGKSQDIREIGRQLDVKTLLEGSVRKAGNRLRISAQLIDVTDGYHLWSERFDREMEDIFSIQDEISLAIVEKLKGKLLKKEKEKLTKRYTEDPEAYTLYLRGRYHWNRRTTEELNKAISIFQQVIEKDPEYALAYAGLADCYSLLEQTWALPPQETFPKAREYAEKALAIDDSLAEAHNSLAYVRWRFEWDWRNAEKEFKRALDLNPNYGTAHQWYSAFLMLIGKHDQAIEEIRKAQELDPLSPLFMVAASLVFCGARRFDKAKEEALRAIEIDPNFGAGHWCLAWAYEFSGQKDEAIEYYLKGELWSEFIDQNEERKLRKVFQSSGWRGFWEQHVSFLKKRRTKEYIPASAIAHDYLRLGEKEEALRWLEKAYQNHDVDLTSLNSEPIYDILRDDQRFQDLMKRVGFPI